MTLTKLSMNLKNFKTDKSWTLFLDRDGVINRKIENSYVLKWDDFRFIDGVKEAFRIFKYHFDKIIVVTNQQCISKGLVAAVEIEFIHDKMIKEISENGGRIDRIYFSPDVAGSDILNNSHEKVSRKPGTAMAFQALNDFPCIDFKKSVMVGDSYSDMLFGKRLGMTNVLIRGNKIYDPEIYEFVFQYYNNLKEFADDL